MVRIQVRTDKEKDRHKKLMSRWREGFTVIQMNNHNNVIVKDQQVDEHTVNIQDMKRFVVLPEWMICPSMKPINIWEMDYSKEIEFVPSKVQVELHVED